MKLSNCKIVFDNQLSEYSAGELVSGKVVLYCKSAKTIRGIQIEFFLVEKTYWSEGRYQVFRAHQKNNIVKHFIAGGDQKSDSVQLQIGKNIFVFMFQLPPDLPPSFKGRIGHMRYYFKVFVVRSSIETLNSVKKTRLTIVNSVDLNVARGCREPVSVDFGKIFYKLFSIKSDGKLTGCIKLPRGGFLPGEEIPICLEIQNDSSVHVSKIIIVLKQSATYHAKFMYYNTKTLKEKITSVKELEKIPPNCARIFNKTLTIPELIPTHFRNFDLIEIAYELDVKFKFDGTHVPFIKTIPITIGTVPLRQMNDLQSMLEDLQVPSEASSMQSIINYKISALLKNNQQSQKNLTDRTINSIL